MTPTALLAIILSTLYGAAFHLLVGGSARRLWLYLLAGWLGFALGHGFAVWLDIGFGRLGTLNVFTATLGGWIALGASRLLVASEAIVRREK